MKKGFDWGLVFSLMAALVHFPLLFAGYIAVYAFDASNSSWAAAERRKTEDPMEATMAVEYYDDEVDITKADTTVNPVVEEDLDFNQYAEEEEPEAMGEAMEMAEPKQVVE